MSILSNIIYYLLHMLYGIGLQFLFYKVVFKQNVIKSLKKNVCVFFYEDSSPLNCNFHNNCERIIFFVIFISSLQDISHYKCME